MSIVKNIDDIVLWAEKNICSEIKFKVPPTDEDEPSGSGYDYQSINPVAFAMAMQPVDKLSQYPTIPIPSLCVSVIEGSDSISANLRTMKIRFSFSTWNPGEHGQDLYIPTSLADINSYYVVWNTEEAREHFKKNSEGWRDSWNFVDIALRELYNAENLGQLRIAKEKGIKFGPFMKETEVLDFYPFWFAWLEFFVEYSVVIVSKHKEII